MRTRLLSLPLLGVLALLPVYAGAPPDRVLRLENAVLAPCCYTEPVSRHQSEIAMKMRLEIARWVDEGRPDDEILATYVERYGSKVLVDPNTLPRDWSYQLPWLLSAVAAIALAAMIRRWRRATPATASDSLPAENLPDLPPEDE